MLYKNMFRTGEKISSISQIHKYMRSQVCPCNRFELHTHAQGIYFFRNSSISRSLALPVCLFGCLSVYLSPTHCLVQMGYIMGKSTTTKKTENNRKSKKKQPLVSKKSECVFFRIFNSHKLLDLRTTNASELCNTCCGRAISIPCCR